MTIVARPNASPKLKKSPLVWTNANPKLKKSPLVWKIMSLASPKLRKSLLAWKVISVKNSDSFGRVVHDSSLLELDDDSADSADIEPLF